MILTVVITIVNIRRLCFVKKKKKITQEEIIKTALDLMRDKNEPRTVNMREVARTLGCAHTNIYNYFTSYSELLWETHTALLEVFITTLQENLSMARTPEIKMAYYFDTFVQIYFKNKGWFRLAWLEYIGEDRPQSNKDTKKRVYQALNNIISGIWEEIMGVTPDSKTVDQVVHTTHCYIIGEVSNYISGRALISNEADLKEYIVKEGINILKLYMEKE